MLSLIKKLIEAISIIFITIVTFLIFLILFVFFFKDYYFQWTFLNNFNNYLKSWIIEFLKIYIIKLEVLMPVSKVQNWSEWFWGVNAGEKLPSWWEWFSGTIPGHEQTWFRFIWSTIIKPLAVIGYYLGMTSPTIIDGMYSIFTPVIPDGKILSGVWVISITVVLASVLIY